MLKSIEMTGATRDLAIEKALAQLGMDRDDVSVEVLDSGKKGFLGFGATDAKVRISFEVPDEPAEKPAQKLSAFESIPADDPRRTTPHLVKRAPEGGVPAEQQDKPARSEGRAPREERAPREDRAPRMPREERAPRENRAPRMPREERAPIVPYIDPVPMPQEEIPQAAAAVVKFIEGLLEKLNIEGKAAVLAASEADHIRIDISGADMGPVIGRRGDTLDAIQYLSSLVLNQSTEEHIRLTIDTENYRAKRAESLERLARKMAVKVCKYRKSMTLEPMNPYERRIIHAALQDFRGVATHSTGSEPGRRVVISPDGAPRPRRDFQPRTRQ